MTLSDLLEIEFVRLREEAIRLRAGQPPTAASLFKFSDEQWSAVADLLPVGARDDQWTRRWLEEAANRYLTRPSIAAPRVRMAEAARWLALADALRRVRAEIADLGDFLGEEWANDDILWSTWNELVVADTSDFVHGIDILASQASAIGEKISRIYSPKTRQRDPFREMLYETCFYVWTRAARVASSGGGSSPHTDNLGISRTSETAPVPGVPDGPLLRFMVAVTTAVMGEDAPKPETIIEARDRYREREAKRKQRLGR